MYFESKYCCKHPEIEQLGITIVIGEIRCLFDDN